MTKAKAKLKPLAKAKLGSRVVLRTLQHPEGNYQLELVACGKPKCRKCHGTAHKHGPYWYLYQWQPAHAKGGKHQRGKMRSIYVGKHLERRIA